MWLKFVHIVPVCESVIEIGVIEIGAYCACVWICEVGESLIVYGEAIGFCWSSSQILDLTFNPSFSGLLLTLSYEPESSKLDQKSHPLTFLVTPLIHSLKQSHFDDSE